MDEVRGIGEGTPDGWVIEEYEVPMPGSVNEIGDLVKAILKAGQVQSIELRLKKPIRYTKFVKESEADQKRRVEESGDMLLGEAARNVQMVEYFGEKKHPTKIFFDMLLALEARRLHLGFTGLGTNSRFFAWMGLDSVAYEGIENLGGARLVRDKEIPDDNLIVFGSPYRNARVDQVTYAIKVQMFSDDDLEVQHEPKASE